MTDTAVVPVAASAPAPVSPLGCPPPEPRDVELPSFDTLNRISRALTARYTQGISPHAQFNAWFDWLSHLSRAPGRQLELLALAQIYAARLASLALHDGASPTLPFEPQHDDRRFNDPGWRKAPYRYFAQAFLAQEAWWREATKLVRGMQPKDSARVAFMARQLLDAASPSNVPWLNPQIVERTLAERGANLARGFENLLEDWQRAATMTPAPTPPGFELGKDIAVTPGQVVYRNDLMELIQYTPTTPDVTAEPVLIVPAWIMKYYVLDLLPEHSLVRYLVDRGFTVFMISWRNPGPGDRNIAFDDYRRLGVKAAVDVIRDIVPACQIHALGYCLGGTLLSIAAAAMGRDGPFKTITLLASQTDFTEAGELTLFINESQVAFLEDMMWERGVLDTTQMAGAFQLLRSNDLIWSRVSRDYLMGERAPPSDLMAWNADATRLPYRMHSEYLRQLFLNNDLAEGRYLVEGKPIALSDIHAPMFVVGTVRDHVAPWRSTYKIHYQVDADVTYLLTSGGHNAGVVAPPGEDGHFYQVMTKAEDAPYIGPDEWLKAAPRSEGSWWPEWTRWLTARSGEPGEPPRMGVGPADGESLPDAPGDYVNH